MRIALVYDAIFPYVKGGGERIFYELARQLGKRHDVHLFGMKFWPGPSVRQLHPGVWAHGVCRAMPLYKKGDDRRRAIRQALRFAACHPWALLRQGRFDIIDCMSTPYFALYSARLATLLKHTPLLSTWLEIWREDEWKKYLGKVRGTCAQWVERCASRMPSHIIAISEHTREGLERIGVSGDRISVISPGIDWQYLNRLPAVPMGTDVLFVGRLIREKRVDVLLAAIAQLRDRIPGVNCKIVGDGPERRSLEALAEELKVGQNVEFAGFYEKSESVYSEMKGAKVFALPSQREGFGIVVLEAAACGLPTVTVDAPNNAAAHIVRDGELGIVCRLDPSEITSALYSFLKDEDERRRISRHAVEWSRGSDWPQVAEQFESVYEWALARSQGD